MLTGVEVCRMDSEGNRCSLPGLIYQSERVSYATSTSHLPVYLIRVSCATSHLRPVYLIRQTSVLSLSSSSVIPLDTIKTT
jgi:hypothetical protein